MPILFNAAYGIRSERKDLCLSEFLNRNLYWAIRYVYIIAAKAIIFMNSDYTHLLVHTRNGYKVQNSLFLSSWVPDWDNISRFSHIAHNLYEVHVFHADRALDELVERTPNERYQ